MIEIPETRVLSGQLNQFINGYRIITTVADQSHHKLAWYSGDPAGYAELLSGKTAGKASNLGGLVQVMVEDMELLFGDGVNLRFHNSPADVPLKHQLLVGFENGTFLSGTVAMYGGLWCHVYGTFDNPYYKTAGEKPNPLTTSFDEDYFNALFQPELEKYSLKAFLATEQRIPGLGNGVLQDILYNAKLHPKRKVSSLDTSDRHRVFASIKTTLKDMAEQGGRNTEKDLLGNPGGYKTLMSKNTVGNPCPHCGGIIVKEAYMGGSVYYCPGCQK